jgi:peptidoglycan hydrolase-like protein with peptidoglycan-binding domain
MDRKGRFLSLAAGVLTGSLSLAIVANLFFGQPGRVPASLIAQDAAGSPADVPATAPRTIQLRYDPVVEAVQRELLASGYYKGAIDGVTGRRTRQAIEAYQQATGLTVDGRPSASLAEHIRYTREVAEAALFTGSITPDPDAEARATIRRVQTGLAELGYSPGAIGGELTGATRDAILAFERDRNLPPSGEITGALLAELDRLGAESELAGP